MICLEYAKRRTIYATSLRQSNFSQPNLWFGMILNDRIFRFRLMSNTHLSCFQSHTVRLYFARAQRIVCNRTENDLNDVLVCLCFGHAKTTETKF